MPKKTSLEGLTDAPVDIPCRDVWALDQVRKPALLAYRRLEERGVIRIAYPVTLFPGRLVIAYYSAIPYDWVLQELARAEHGNVDCEQGRMAV